MTEQTQKLQKRLEKEVAETLAQNFPAESFRSLPENEKALVCARLVADITVERLINEKVKNAAKEMGVYALLFDKHALHDVFGFWSYQFVSLRLGRGMPEDLQEKIAETTKPKVAKFLTPKADADRLLAIALLFDVAASYLFDVAKEHPEDWHIGFAAEACSGRAELCKMAAKCVA